MTAKNLGEENEKWRRDWEDNQRRWEKAYDELDAEKHKEYTTSGNERILENAVKIANSGVDLIIRTPVVPGFNDNAKDIGDIAKYAKKIGAKEFHLLPYHRLGTDKYDKLGRKYQLTEILPPPDSKMQELLKVALSKGIKSQIGG